MIIQYTIMKKTGQVVAEVLDREGENCEKVVAYAAEFGRQISDERTGPSCDGANEITTE
jgi:hypothetical protein